jgi:hypothetical protein
LNHEEHEEHEGEQDRVGVVQNAHARTQEPDLHALALFAFFALFVFFVFFVVQSPDLRNLVSLFDGRLQA